MNIFVLDTDPRQAAKFHCDAHVVKMVLESAQLLCTLLPKETTPYKHTHVNHPCAVWARQTEGNYEWLLDLALGLADEFRYRRGREHASYEVIRECEREYIWIFNRSEPRQEFAQVVPIEYRAPDPVEAYRAYYRHKKQSWAALGREMKYTKRKEPSWLTTQTQTRAA